MSEPLFDEKLHMANKLGLRNKKILFLTGLQTYLRTQLINLGVSLF